MGKYTKSAGKQTQTQEKQRKNTAGQVAFTCKLCHLGWRPLGNSWPSVGRSSRRKRSTTWGLDLFKWGWFKPLTSWMLQDLVIYTEKWNCNGQVYITRQWVKRFKNEYLSAVWWFQSTKKNWLLVVDHFQQDTLSSCHFGFKIQIYCREVWKNTHRS